MSVSLVLFPVSIAIAVTIADAVNVACLKNNYSKSTNEIKDIQTKYVNSDLLAKTLMEHGANVSAVNENLIVCEYNQVTLTYRRNQSTEPFVMDIEGTYVADELFCNIEEIENEFNGNLQTYSYNKVLENIPEDMQVESEEVLEDNSIRITLSVD